jgi:hypothetical protein
MGLSFPRRFTRSMLGEKLEDAHPVENPKQEIGAGTYNPAFWGLAGLNQVAPRWAWAALYTGGAFVHTFQGEAWNPDNAVAHPTPARAGAGSYSYTFASSYVDEEGTVHNTALGPVRCSSHRVLTAYADRIQAFSFIDPAFPLVVQVRLYDANGNGADHPFWVEGL